MPGVRVAVDAMGGDPGPRVVVPGALRALSRLPADASLVFVGDEARLRAALRGQVPARVALVHAPDEISMHESAATAVRVTNQLPAGVLFASAVASQGSCVAEDGVVRCELGTLAATFDEMCVIISRNISKPSFLYSSFGSFWP